MNYSDLLNHIKLMIDLVLELAIKLVKLGWPF